MASVSMLSKPSVEVALPSQSVDGIPAAFPAAVYEDLIEQLTQSGLFAHVWRADDSRRTAGTLILQVDIEKWRKAVRADAALGLSLGQTEIKSRVTLADASGRTVFQGKVDGAKRMKGENLDVTNSLAKHVRKALKMTPELQLIE